MGILPDISTGELKSFGIGTAVGATIGATITGLIAQKIAAWRIRVKEEETLKSTHSIKTEKLKVKYKDNMVGIKEQFETELQLTLLPSLREFSPTIADLFTAEMNEKGLPHQNARKADYSDVETLSLNQVLGPNQKSDTLQALNELVHLYMERKDDTFDEYTAIVITLSNIIFTTIKFISELRKIPGEDNQNHLKGLEEGVNSFFKNLQKSALVEGRDSEFLGTLRDIAADYKINLFQTGRGGFVNIIKEEMHKVFQEAYADQEKVTSILMSENAALAMENESAAAYDFFLRSTVSQATKQPQNTITVTKVANNTAAFQLTGPNITYNREEAYVYIAETHAKNSMILHAPLSQAEKETPSPQLNRLMNLDGNHKYHLGNHTDTNSPLYGSASSQHDKTLGAAKDFHLYLKYLNIAIAMQHDLTMRLDRYGWEGLKKSGEYEYRIALIKSIKARTNAILEGIIKTDPYFTEWLKHTQSEKFNLSQAQDVFGKGITENDVKVDLNKVIFGEARNNLPYVRSLADIEHQQTNFNTNISALDQVTVRVDNEKTYNPGKEDPTLVMNISLLSQEDAELKTILNANGITTHDSKIKDLLEEMSFYKTSINLPTAGFNTLIDKGQELRLRKLTVTHNDKQMSFADFIESINSDNQFAKYFIYEKDTFKFRDDVYFGNVRELNNFFTSINVLLNVIGNTKDAEGKISIKQTDFFKDLELIQNNMRDIILISLPKNLAFLEAEHKNQQIILLEGLLMQMSKDFEKILNGQFTAMETLLANNAKFLTDELSTKYQNDIDIKRNEIKSLKENFHKQVNDALQNKEKSNTQQIEFLQGLSNNLRIGFENQTTFASQLFTNISNSLGEIITNNNTEIENLRIKSSETEKEKNSAIELQQQTNVLLNNLTTTHNKLLQEHETIKQTIDKASKSQDKLVNFISELISSKQISGLSQSITNIRQKMLDTNKYPEIQQDLDALNAVVTYWSQTLSNAESIINEHQEENNFETLKQSVTIQRKLLDDSTTTIKELTASVVLLQEKYNESLKKQVNIYEDQVTRITNLTTTLSTVQAELVKAKQEVIDKNNQEVKNLQEKITTQKENLTQELDKAYQASYDQLYNSLQANKSNFDTKQQDYLGKRNLLLSLSNPPVLTTYVKFTDSLPPKKNDIKKENYQDAISALNALNTRLNDKINTLDIATVELIKAETTHDTKQAADLELTKIRNETQKALRDKSEELNTAVATAREKSRIAAEQATIEMIDQRNILTKNEFTEKFADFVNLVKTFNAKVILPAGKGGDKHLALNQLIGEITSCYSAQNNPLLMRDLLIQFCALCMQKNARYNMFGKTTATGEKLLAMIKENESINVAAINKALGSPGNNKIIKKDAKEGRYRYRDFATNIASLLETERIDLKKKGKALTDEKITVKRFKS